MTLTYTQYGSVAILYEKGRSVATAVFENGWWRTRTNPSLGHSSSRYHEIPWPHFARTLDELVGGGSRERRTDLSTSALLEERAGW